MARLLVVVALVGAVWVAGHALATRGPEATPVVVAQPGQGGGTNDEAKAREDFAFDAAKAIKGVMRDPGSFVVEEMRVDRAGEVACVKYRARNGFGGIGREAAVVADGKALKATAARWKKYCSHQMYDETAITQ